MASAADQLNALHTAQAVLQHALRSDPNTLLEAKAWLVATISQQQGLTRAVRLACLLPALHGHGRAPLPRPSTTTGLPQMAQRQLLRLLCEMNAQPAVELLSTFPGMCAIAEGCFAEHACSTGCHSNTLSNPCACADLLRDFFKRSDAAIRGWFSHFSMGGISEFRHGALALANWTLTHRDTAWQHLVWSGRHSQAPVAVASKTHYFCELDIVASVRALIRHAPEFWSSQELLKAVRGAGATDFLAIDMEYMCSVRPLDLGRVRRPRQQ